MNHPASQMPAKVERDFAWLKKVRPQLADWLLATFTYISAEFMCEVFERGDSACVNVFSDKNVYSIVCGTDGDDYLGMTHASRVTRAGNDHSDGPYDETTWNRIIRDILSCELISLKRVADSSHED